MRRVQPIVLAVLAMTVVVVFAGTLMAAHLGVSLRPADEGIVVASVAPDGPAAKAGVRSGDTIIGIDDQPVADAQEFIQRIRAHKSGDRITLKIRRGDKEESIPVTLAEPPPVLQPRRPRQFRPAFLGVFTQELTGDLKERLGVEVDKGVLVVVVLPNTPADKAGLRRDDVITHLNDQPIANEEELRDAVQKAGAGKEVTLQVVRSKETKEIKLQLDPEPDFPPGFPPGLRDFPAPQVDFPFPNRKLEQLERRIEQLEERLRKLEDKTQPR